MKSTSTRHKNAYADKIAFNPIGRQNLAQEGGYTRVTGEAKYQKQTHRIVSC